MIKFIKSLLSEKDNSASVKNAMAVLICFILCLDDVANLFWNFTIAEFIFFGLLTLVSGIFGIKAYLSGKVIDTKQDVANNIVDKEPADKTADDAKDVLNSDKP